MAKLFMPDQETQLAARRFQQNEDLFQSRLLDADVARENAANRDTYEKKRLAQLDEHKLLHEERGRILARAAKQGRDLTPAEAARLVAINGTIRGTVSPDEIAKGFALPQAKAQAKAKAEAKVKAEQDKANADKLAAEQKVKDATLERKSSRFKGVYEAHETPIDQIKLRNNIMNLWNSSPKARESGLLLTEASADQLAGFAFAQGYTNAELMTAAKKILYGNTEVKDPLTTNTKFEGTQAYSEADMADLERRTPAADWPAAKVRYQKMRKIGAEDVVKLGEWAARKPEVLRFAGTPEAIRAFTLRNKGKKIVFYDTVNERFGGGVATSNDDVINAYKAARPGEIAPDWEQANPYLLPWTEGDEGAAAGP
jgi:hypothetical protein